MKKRKEKRKVQKSVSNNTITTSCKNQPEHNNV